MVDESLPELFELSPLVSGDAMTVVGGTVDEAGVEQLARWLQSLGEDGWWSFREWTDRMRLAKDLAGTEGDVARLVWARWFGTPGDLEVRRDGPRFRWRWVGDAGVRPPEELAGKAMDFFAVGEGAPVLLRPAEANALLWDARDARIATTDPATRAALLPNGERLCLRYTVYYDHGVVAVVRYHGIESDPASAPAGE
jgi:hypothetical protein